jgi:hypothetical protein
MRQGGRVSCWYAAVPGLRDVAQDLRHPGGGARGSPNRNQSRSRSVAGDHDHRDYAYERRQVEVENRFSQSKS